MRFAFIFCLMPLLSWAQPIQRQFWTTNTNPREVVAQGTNVFITFSTPSPDVRQYLIDVPSMVGQTNNTVLSAGTNVVIVTNVSGAVTVYTVSAVPGVQTNVTLLAAGTNVFVHSATNNGVITYTIDVPTNAFLQRTQWAITDITNSLNLTNWALLSTNAFTNVIVSAGSNAYVTPSLSGQVRTYTVDVPTQSGGGSSNITDSGYIAVARNVNVSTNLNVTNTANFWGTLSTSNVYFQPTLTANLPTPSAGNFPIMYASDVVTSRGTGDHVKWNGSNWTTMENVVATANLTNFMLNAWGALLNAQTPISSIFSWRDIGLDSPGSPGQALGWSYVANNGFLGTLGSGSASDWNILSTSSSATGRPVLYGPSKVPTASDVYGCGASVYLSVLPNGSDNYFAMVGHYSDPTSSSNPNSRSGAFFIFDMYTNTVPADGTTRTNNWICGIVKAGSAVWQDSKLPAATSAGAQRLGVILTTSSVIFYTNGVACFTYDTAANLPAVYLYYGVARMNKTLGSTSRYMAFNGFNVNVRNATALSLP